MLKLKDIQINFKYAFRYRKPLTVMRLAKAFFDTNIFNRKRLRYVDFAIDYSCNLKCKHCFATALKDNARKRMELEDYRRVAEECMRLGAVNFSFQGGEPLLYDKLPDIINACSPELNIISVTTNGTLLTKEKIKSLRRSGVDILTVSLDSSKREEHDLFRGMTGAFDKTMTGIKLALECGIRITIGTVVTHQTLKTEGLKGLIDFALKHRILLYFILPVPAGSWNENTDILLDNEDLLYLNGLTESSPYLRTDFQANLGGYGCGAAKEILYLTPYGDVLTCPFIHISPGNIFDESVSAIRNRALQEPLFSTYHDKCLASTDKEFIKKHLSRTFNSKNLPIPWSEVFHDEKK
jgi:MoaA/NifB/PqqE/SkfB family radical SAM enzyme